MVKRYNANPKNCKHCGQPLPYEKRRNDFCSQSCAAMRNNMNRKGKYKRQCKQCGRPIPSGRQFCSNLCQQKKKQAELEKKIYETGEFRNSKYENMRFVRKMLAKMHGYKCSICGISQWRGQKLVLVVDHIDGNAENHKVENYRLVCPNCNSQLPTFAGRNRGKGRKWRRDKRKEQERDI